MQLQVNNFFFFSGRQLSILLNGALQDISWGVSSYQDARFISYLIDETLTHSHTMIPFDASGKEAF